MDSIHYALGDHGAAIRDIKRKLACIDPEGDPVLMAFKTAPCSANFDADTAAAICAFRKLNGDESPVGECDEKTWHLLNAQAGSLFDETWQYEMEALRGEIPQDVKPVCESLAAKAHLHHFAGLAFSGGGIRSATFNLGMLQALSELRLLRDFDYLSTVSGGGYIGGWFSKWLKRQQGNVKDIEHTLTPGSSDNPRREPEEVKFLRQYTNYLTPKTGFFSADTWALLGTYLRNTMLNLTILALVLAAVMVVPRVLALFINGARENKLAWLTQLQSHLAFPLFSCIAVVAALWAVVWIAASVSALPNPASRYRLWRQSQNSIIWFVVLPLMVAAFFGSAVLWSVHVDIHKSWDDLFNKPSWDNAIVAWLYWPGLAYFGAWVIGWTLAQFHNQSIEKRKAQEQARLEGKPPPIETKFFSKNWKELLAEGGGHLLCAVTVLAVGTVLVVMVTSALDAWHSGPPAATLIPSAVKTATAAQKVTAAAQSVTSSAQTVTSGAATVTALARRTPVPEVALVPALASTAAAVPQTAPAPTAAEKEANTTVPLIAFGMPILLSLFGITMIFSVGLVGRMYTDKSREWWSRQSGWTTIIVTGWFALITVSLYAPAVIGYIHSRLGDWASAAVGSAWLGATLSGLMLGKSGATGGPNGKSRLDWLARAAPLIFSIGAVCIVSSLLHALLLKHDVSRIANSDTTFIGFLAAYDLETMTSTFPQLGLVLAALLTTGIILAWRVDINKFSLHMMYRNRLVRAYLGASNQQRQAHPFTGFDPADDEHMDDLFAPNGKQVQRPYHIVNTALNLVNGQELAWQTRKAANFTFTPAFCGFELPSMASPGGARVGKEAMRGGFRRTAGYRPYPPSRHDEEKGINLGMAVAVSGAAASPSMGYHSSPPLAFLMTLFNVRLGRWFANPVRPVRRKKGKPTQTAAVVPENRSAQSDKVSTAGPRVNPPRTSPKIGLWYLLKELFGLTDATADFVYLSDGGHFENLGIYELVRRRCRLIVVVDAGADGQFDFEDLGNAVRKCTTDLSVEIEIDVGKIDLLQPAQFSRSHCVTGTIRYDKVDEGAPVGTLLYIKPSLLGTEYADVLNYRKTNKTFPHQPTADQWFDEAQFETYRSLGYSIGKIALERAANAALKNALDRHDIESLCDALHANWAGHVNVGLPTAAQPAGPIQNNRRTANRRQLQIVPNVQVPITPERRQNDDRRTA